MAVFHVWLLTLPCWTVCTYCPAWQTLYVSFAAFVCNCNKETLLLLLLITIGLSDSNRNTTSFELKQWTKHGGRDCLHKMLNVTAFAIHLSMNPPNTRSAFDRVTACRSAARSTRKYFTYTLFLFKLHDSITRLFTDLYIFISSCSAAQVINHCLTVVVANGADVCCPYALRKLPAW